MTKATDFAYIEGMRDGYASGRRDALRLVYIGAACAAILHDRRAERLVAVTPMVQAYARGQVADGVAEAALRALADMGDERAREMLR
jgi:hypothetical protein